MLEIRLSHGYTLCVPDNLALMTPYVLLEQEAWFEDEVDVLPKLAPEGSVLVDVGANHGVYTLALACRAASHGGRVLAYEPNPELHAGLRASLELNGLSRFVSLKSEGLSREAGQARFHIPLNPELASLSPVHGAKEVDVQLTTVNDVAASLDPGERIGLVKLDAEGAELDILAGADIVLREHQPIVMFEIKHGSEMNHGLAEAFIERGYGLFRVLPGFGLLAPWAPGEPIDGYQLNLIACTATEAVRLQKNGLLLTPEQLEAPAPDEGIDAAVLRRQLHADVMQLPVDLQILGMHLAIAMDGANEASSRYAHAHAARRGLQSRLAENTLAPEWRLALARLNQMLGERSAALADIHAVLLQLSEVQSPQILVSPHPAFDQQPPGPDRLGWLRTALHESRVRLLRYSGYFGVDLNQLKAIHAMPEHTLEMDRRLALAMLKAGKRITILPESALCSDRHLNAAVWQQIAQGNYRVEVPGHETNMPVTVAQPVSPRTPKPLVTGQKKTSGTTSRRKALITGITGQDGSYLAEFLLEKGYEVHGIKRRASSLNTQRIDHLYEDPHTPDPRMVLHYGDLTDSSNLIRILQQVQPDEVYNLGAQSHVAVSFDSPEYTADVDALGALRLLEAIRLLGMGKRTRFYQASTSELYGLVQETPQKETTPFYPRSPYAVAKLYAYWITVNYREAYGMYACNGILFNHESPRRGETFVTRKITRGLTNIAQGLETCLHMGNIDALRDWGHAKDYVRMQWMMLQQEQPEDFVIATGKQYTVREFIKWSAAELGITLRFTGSGVDECAVVDRIDGDKAPALKVGDVIVRVDPRYFRPAEVETLLGDPGKAKKKLGWEPEITVQQMCAEMVAEDLKIARRHAFLKANGHDVQVTVEN